MKKAFLNKLGMIGGILSIIFFLCFLILGFLQPGYNHIRDTVSLLVGGKYGWIQSLNFIVISLAAVFIGITLKKNLIGKKNFLAKAVFLICILELIVILFFPAEKYEGFEFLSLTGKIHLSTAFLLIISISIMIFSIIKDMKNNLYFNKLVSYSYFVSLFNLVFGIIWYCFNDYDPYFGWRGLFEKIIILNMIIWLSVIGFRIRRIKK